MARRAAGCSIRRPLAEAPRAISARIMIPCSDIINGRPITYSGNRGDQNRSPCADFFFTEKLIGTIRREYLDQMLFWNKRDLEEKLGEFKDYYNAHRVHRALDLKTPDDAGGKGLPTQADLRNFAWLAHCRGLFHTPIRA
ncbi:MAG: integrase core domain-containing protein [bacterium]|nr:integrase core domain-containing protein [bacterium]